METTNTPKELGMRILHEFYCSRNKRPGDCHTIGTFLDSDGWSSEDLSNGLTYCVEKGWLEKVNDSWILTEEGFEVSRLEDERGGQTNIDWRKRNGKSTERSSICLK
jgi:hypothetical protein